MRRLRQSIYERCWTQIVLLRKLVRFARRPPLEQLWDIRFRLARTDWYWKVQTPKNHRTAYIRADADDRFDTNTPASRLPA